jgi:hypothetical protein
MQNGEIDRSLDIEAEAATSQQSVDDIAAAGLPPQPAEHEIRANADPLQFGELAAIEARQHN